MNLSPKSVNMRIVSGKNYLCIEDWCNSFTKGKIYHCCRNNFLYDDFGNEKDALYGQFLCVG